ncbi:MAG: DtxR family transcriptional regulator [Deltaproteobacteria bacterium]|nr:DtxR family transcriptional regulator [Deltaproteobacteria bacterium]
METIFELVRDRKVARVRDIAEARQVKASSVTPAMRRLSRMGLIKYERREFIELTAEGEKLARRVYSRHQILERFFQNFLGLNSSEARENACAMEHSLTNEAMERFVRLFEFLRGCPAGKELLQTFLHCSEVQGATRECAFDRALKQQSKRKREHSTISLFDLKPGKKGRVIQINAKGSMRRRMLDLGILPDTIIEIERIAPSGDPVWIKLGGFQLSLRKREAESVLLTTV